MLHRVKTAEHAAFLERELLTAHALQDTAGARALVSKHNDTLMNFFNLSSRLWIPLQCSLKNFNLQPAFVMVHPVKTAEHAAFLEQELLTAHALQDTAGVRALVSKHNDVVINFVNHGKFRIALQ